MNELRNEVRETVEELEHARMMISTALRKFDRAVTRRHASEAELTAIRLALSRTFDVIAKAHGL